MPLEQWREHSPRVLDLERGLSRHEVQFVGDDHHTWAIKRTTVRAAEREYNMLVQAEERRLPCVRPAGWLVVHAPLALNDGGGGDAGEPCVGMLVTEFLEGSLPYRTLFRARGLERYRDRLLDAMAGLFVRLHLAGFYWGDCSLSNTLFRRDGGELSAYLVDAETSEMHPTLSPGQREHDLSILDGDYHRHQLHTLTGLSLGEHQARQMLNEVRELRAELSCAQQRPVSLSAAAYRWQRERFEPAVARLMALGSADDTALAERYCEVLEHKWLLSERECQDVGLLRALEGYLALMDLKK